MYCKTMIRHFILEETGSLSWRNVPWITRISKEKSDGVPDDDSERAKHHTFELECAAQNRIPAFVILSMSCIMECIMIAIYIIQPYVVQKERFFPGYIYLYVFMTLFSLFMMILINRFKTSPKKLMNLEYIVLVVMSIWSAVFSALDVGHGYSCYLFIQLMIINSLIFKVNPRKHCLINVLGFLVYTAIIIHEKLGITALFVSIVNPLFMMIVACAVIVLNYHIKYKYYLNQQLVKEQHEQLEYYANYDFLTKVPNRKNIIDYLEEFVKEKRENIACMMIDIDNFKLYNDTYGHISGDSCLIQLAQAMAGYVESQGGKLGRYGGEEFLAVFSGISRQDVLQIADTLREIVEGENILFETNTGSIATVSIGVFYQSQASDSDYITLLRFADRALYKAKTEGRNRAVLYNDRIASNI